MKEKVVKSRHSLNNNVGRQRSSADELLTEIASVAGLNGVNSSNISTHTDTNSSSSSKRVLRTFDDDDDDDNNDDNDEEEEEEEKEEGDEDEEEEEDDDEEEEEDDEKEEEDDEKEGDDDDEEEEEEEKDDDQQDPENLDNSSPINRSSTNRKKTNDNSNSEQIFDSTSSSDRNAIRVDAPQQASSIPTSPRTAVRSIVAAYLQNTSPPVEQSIVTRRVSSRVRFERQFGEEITSGNLLSELREKAQAKKAKDMKKNNERSPRRSCKKK